MTVADLISDCPDISNELLQLNNSAHVVTKEQLELTKGSCPPTEGFYEIMELAYRHMVPLALNTAVMLGIPDIIAKAGPGAALSLEEIVNKLPRQNANTADHVGRILRILVQNDVFSERSESTDGKLESRFGLTSLSKWLVTESNEFHMVPMVLMKMRREMVNCFLELHSAILDGTDPFQVTNGTDLFHYTSLNPGFTKVFNDALSCRAKTMNWLIAHNYTGFGDIRTLVDVGGCRGQALATIVSRHPHIHGINFDLAHVVASAPSIPGVTHVAGNMFEQIPRADAILLEQVLHDWSDDRCLEILRKCYTATPDNGKVIIRENVLRAANDRSAQSRVAHAANLGMLSYCGEGKERTANEWRTLITAAGYSRIHFLNFSGLDVLEVLKS